MSDPDGHQPVLGPDGLPETCTFRCAPAQQRANHSLWRHYIAQQAENQREAALGNRDYEQVISTIKASSQFKFMDPGRQAWTSPAVVAGMEMSESQFCAQDSGSAIACSEPHGSLNTYDDRHFWACTHPGDFFHEFCVGGTSVDTEPDTGIAGLINATTSTTEGVAGIADRNGRTGVIGCMVLCVGVTYQHGQWLVGVGGVGFGGWGYSGGVTSVSSEHQGAFSEQYCDSFGALGGCISAGPRDKGKNGYVGVDYAPGAGFFLGGLYTILDVDPGKQAARFNAP